MPELQQIKKLQLYKQDNSRKCKMRLRHSPHKKNKTEMNINFEIWQTQKDFCAANKIKKSNLSQMIARGNKKIKTKIIAELNNIILIRKIK